MHDIKKEAISQNEQIGSALMQKIISLIGEKLLHLIFTLLIAAITGCVTILWRLSGTVENHEVRLQAIESRYAQTKDLKNIELIADKSFAGISHQMDRMNERFDRLYEQVLSQPQTHEARRKK